MSERFAGQVVLVTGGTGALGRAVSAEFLGEGARVFVTYQHQRELDSLRDEAGAIASRLEGQAIDVTDHAAVTQLVTDIIATHGRLDVAVNCIGGYAAGWKLWETKPEIMEQMLALNLRSGYAVMKSVVPAMLKQGRGAIVNVAAKAAFDHAASAAAYAASKSAALAMIDSLAADLKDTNIRANSILPSIIDTEANRRAMPNADFSKWPKPREIARVILFLASDDAKVIRGAAVPV
ncbi:MAG: SDR family NAD(P)-dependent oxidoreductase [Acidobacteriota bacterium]|nr:SDR family NAD(P)-dependent oxidoreductase [Acidobacteriota bacterium]MDE3170682.1 SDR family NAD(P)-dependent oxidoreductase [Acidobacteriota bacterium]